MKTEKDWKELITIIEEEDFIIGEMLSENTYYRYYAFAHAYGDLLDKYTRQRYCIMQISKITFKVEFMTLLDSDLQDYKNEIDANPNISPSISQKYADALNEKLLLMSATSTPSPHNIAVSPPPQSPSRYVQYMGGGATLKKSSTQKIPRKNPQIIRSLLYYSTSLKFWSRKILPRKIGSPKGIQFINRMIYSQRIE